MSSPFINITAAAAMPKMHKTYTELKKTEQELQRCCENTKATTVYTNPTNCWQRTRIYFRYRM